MSDDAIKEMERTLRGSPADSGLRIRFAHSLLRIGRDREALDALDCAHLDREHYEGAREVADRLWREEIARFERVDHVFPYGSRGGPAIDLTGRIAVFGMPSYFQVVDLARRGEVVHHEPGRLNFPWPVRGGVYFRVVHRNGSEAIGWARLPLDAPGARGEIEVGARAPRGDEALIGVSPAGDLVALERRLRRGYSFRICRLPSFELVAKGPWEPGGVVLWESGHVVTPSRVVPWRDGATAAFRDFAGSNLGALGGSVVATEEYSGVAIHDVVQGWSQRLESKRKVWLAHDGRTLRASTRSRTFEYDLDPETGDLFERGHQSIPGHPLFHPGTDVYIPNDGSRILAWEGHPVLELPPDARPYFWIMGGHGLLVFRHPQVGIELWRAPEAR
jgi:hypothetical protein